MSISNISNIRYIDDVDRSAQDPVGYCHKKGGCLSKGLSKSHKCLQRKCPYLEMYTETYMFWNSQHDGGFTYTDFVQLIRDAKERDFEPVVNNDAESYEEHNTSTTEQADNKEVLSSPIILRVLDLASDVSPKISQSYCLFEAFSLIKKMCSDTTVSLADIEDCISYLNALKSVM